VTSPAVIDLLGVLAYGELVAFERTAADASLAPTLEDKTALAHMAAAEFAHFEQISAHLTSLGTDPIAAMQPFVSALNQFHNTLTPRDWLEGLLKAYVGDGIANDFYREISSHMDSETAKLVTEVLSDVGHAEFAVERIRNAIEQDPKVAGRLALWGRRLMGEMISQATLVAGFSSSASRTFLTSTCW
jgi:1,2-phenylacetyl-CoA epoxidase catalytic subunit